MLEIANDYVEGNPAVDTIYVYGGLTAMVLYECFYSVGGKIYTLPDVDPALGQPRKTSKEWGEPMKEGTELVRLLLHLYADNGRDTPYELRMVYDCRQ